MASPSESVLINKKRTVRGRYMDSRDKSLLLSITKKYEDVILTRKIDQATNLTKALIWRKIAAEFNAKSLSHRKRSGEQLKNIYRNKRAAMKRRILASTCKVAQCEYEANLKVHPRKFADYQIKRFENSATDNIELLSSEQSLECSTSNPEVATIKCEPLPFGEHSLIESTTLASIPLPAQSTDSNLQLLDEEMQHNNKSMKNVTVQAEGIRSPESFCNGKKMPASFEKLKSNLFEEYIKIGKLKQKLLQTKIKYFEEKTRLLSYQCNGKK